MNEELQGKCEVCGSSLPPTTITEVDEGGVARSRFLCETHAQEAGYPIPSAENDLLPKLRHLIAFIKANQRMPSPVELQQLRGAGSMSYSRPGSKEFNERLAYLESLAEFIETRGRIPSERELPDPF